MPKRKKSLGGQATQLNLESILAQLQPQVKRVTRRGKLDTPFVELRVYVPLNTLSIGFGGSDANG